MGIVVATFVLTLAIVAGSYWLLVAAPEARRQRALEQRLQTPAGTVPAPVLAVEEPPLSGLAVLNSLLHRVRGPIGPLRRLIARSALPFTPGTVLLATIFAGLLGYSAMRYLSPLPALAWIAAGPAAVLPLLFVWFGARRRMAKFEEHFPVAIDLISRALRAGHSLPAAMELVAREVPDPIGTEFRLLFERQNYGLSLADALRGFAARVPLIDARFFVTAVLTQREVGGNLSEVLDNLSKVIRERFTVRREIRVSSAHGRITGWVLGLMAPAVAFLLFTINPDHMLLLVRDPIGMQMVGVAVALQLIGVLFIRRIVNVEY